MALMWLLAEFWGRVTPAGIRLPLSLSHEVLGGLVGARRSTVTLAVSKLADRGSLIRHEEEWLILEPPTSPVSSHPEAPHLLLTPPATSLWAAQDPVEHGPDGLPALIQQVAQAREAFERDRLRARQLTEQTRVLLEQSRRLTTDRGGESWPRSSS